MLQFVKQKCNVECDLVKLKVFYAMFTGFHKTRGRQKKVQEK